MASSKESYKQDLVISIRYKNDLPPPSMPPKLLDIDTGGLQQYLDPGFAASIAKREEPNIEADAEGGMPIDVIGMYGYFEGDESSIMAPEVALPLEPEDEALMLTPEQLKAGGAVNASNFLRKTQYMTSTSAMANDPLRGTQPRARRESKSKPVVLARDDKENIKRNIHKAFDLVAGTRQQDPSSAPITPAERQAWTNPTHPSNRQLKPVAFYPVLPDFEAATAIASSWNLVRFDKPPLPATKGHRDNRIDAAFLMSNEHPEKRQAWEDQKAAHEADPKNFDDPGNPPAVWSLLLPRDQGATSLIRKIMNSKDPEHNDDGVLARVAEPDERDNDRLKIPLDRARFYSNATSQDKEMGRHTRQVVLTLSNSKPPVAHYYPIGQANKLMSDRANTKTSLLRDFEADLPDQFLVEPRDPTNGELANRYYQWDENDPSFSRKYAEITRAAEREMAEQQAEEENGDAGVDDRAVEAGKAVAHAEDVEMDDADDA